MQKDNLGKKGNSVELKFNNERKVQIQRKTIYSARYIDTLAVKMFGPGGLFMK